MVSGNKSKAARKARPVVVRQKATPWGLIAGVTVVVLVAIGVFGYAYVRNQENVDRREANEARAAAAAPFSPTADNPDPSTAIPGVVTQQYGGGQHVEPTTQVAYSQSPPYGGAHDYSWAACNGVVYPTAVRSENLVHSLEHGAVWITYNPDQVTGEALALLQDRVRSQQYTVMSPYPGLDQPISMQSWGHQLKLSDANDPRIDQFIAALRVNPNTHPENGASCNELGPGSFSQESPPPFAPAPAPGTPGAQVEDTPGAVVTPDQGS